MRNILIIEIYKELLAQLVEKYRRDMAKMNKIITELIEENVKLEDKLKKLGKTS